MGEVKEIKSKHYIQNLIEDGEHERQDFKFKISDARKIARSISAFANNSGGSLLIGVKDNGKVIGVESDEELYMIEQAAELYCRPPQKVSFQSYRVEGKSVLKVDAQRASELPVKAQDDDKKWCAYYRVADENILASALHVKVWKEMKKEAPCLISFTEKEQILIDYLNENKEITLEEYMKIAHLSKQLAENTLIKLCVMHTLAIKYKNGKCVLVLDDSSLLAI
jgi:predicted HTH transcriptional regulator